ncbi:beta-propeller fold lactonase family protein, partial [Candidatus Uhrbacteria bacterium]|nr:beta-propeller fold lactonase family protein [Candidatus Uhrbacteria bacterium]
LTTSTQDVLMGGGNTTSSALFVVDYRGNTGTATNTILLGGVTTTFVGIGTSTPQTTLDVAGSVSNILRSGQTLSLYRNITGVGSTPNQVVVRGNYLHLINKNTAANNFKIFDVSNPASSTVVGTLSISSGTPERMSIVGNRAYVITESPSLLYAIDLSDRARPVVLSSVAIIDTNVRDIDVSGQYAYVSSYDTGSIEKFDISNPTAMTSVVQITSGTHSWLDVEVQGRYLYAVDNYTPTLQIYDASATTPLLKSELSITGAQGLSVQGRFAYVTLSSGGVQVVDIASSTRPIALGSLVIGTNSNRSTVDGRYLYISNESGSSISVVDVSSSTAPNLVRTVTVGSTPRGLSVAGRYLYVPNSGATTISIIDLLGTEVSSLTAANALIGGLQVLQDMMVQGNMDVGGDLTVGGVNVCLSDGTNCPAAGGSWTENATNNTVSLATVSRDVLMGGNTTDTAGFIWDKDVNGTSTLFVGATTNTNIVFGVNTTSFNNITGLSGYVMDGNDLLVGGTVGALNGLAVRGNIDAELGVGQQFKATTTNYLSGYSGPITVHGRYLYQAESSGLVIYDLGQSGKESPKMVTAATNYYSGGNYNDITYFNGYILLSSSDGYTVVVDVSSSTNPIALTQWGNGGGTNRQHSVPHPNGRYVYTTNGLDGINVTDMIDPLNPVELFTTSTNNASDAIYDMKTDGRYLYVANASTPSMEIYDLKIPTRPILISRITTGLSAITKLVVQDDYAYIVEGPAYNEIEIVDIKDRKNPKIVKTITPDGTNRADQIIVAGKYMYLGSLAPEGIDIYDISSSTNPIFIQTIADANIDPGNMILVGKTLYTSGLNTIGSMDVGGIEVNALKAYTAEMTRLLVRDSLDVFQDARIEGGLTVGSLHSNQSYGSISVYASTTSGTVMSLVNESYNSLDAVLEVRGGCGTTSTRDLALFGTRADSRKVSIRCDGQIYADNGTISTPADYAEYFFASSSDLVAGDAVVLNTDILAYASTSRAHILKGDSDLRAKTLGIISTQPGFVANGAEGREQDPQWKVVALMGQVPAKADATAAAIKAGDDVMVGDGGVIIKARGPGMVIGRALEPLASGTSTIQVYVQPHWWAGELFTTDNSGNALLVDDITVASSTVASTTSSLVDSPYFTFMSKAWDAVSSTEVTHSFKLFADAISPTTSLFSIVNASGTSLLDLSNEGDLTVHGKLYLANKSTGIGSTSTYLFIDDTTPSSTMVSTNADGFQAQTSFDYAERYPSQENLEPGDLVTFDPTGPALSMKRTTSVKDAVSGIVSTKPGFLTGAYVKGTYPIALAGRVPTKVTASNGSIKTGDALTASNIPGVAMKATQPGIIVGYALANFDLPETGLIEVFVKTGYFGGTVDAAGVVNYEPQNAAIKPVEVEGLALIAAGQQEVTIRFDSLKALPTVYAAPGASVDGGWWIASKTDTGFTIVLEKPQMHDVEFSWLARPLQMGVMRFKSDNTNETVDLLSGNGIPQVQDSGGGSPSSTSSTQTP